MVNRWLKYSSLPFVLDRSTKITQRDDEHLSYFAKPKGLWLTDEAEMNWWDWCMAKSFMLERLSHKTEIVLDMSNILELRSPKDLDYFTFGYGTRDHYLARHMRTVFGDYDAPPAIQWDRVAKDFRGIAITPYIWGRRMDRHTSWYYTWDCSSACIWDYDAILSVRAIAPPLLLEAPAPPIL